MTFCFPHISMKRAQNGVESPETVKREREMPLAKLDKWDWTKKLWILSQRAEGNENCGGLSKFMSCRLGEIWEEGFLFAVVKSIYQSMVVWLHRCLVCCHEFFVKIYKCGWSEANSPKEEVKIRCFLSECEALHYHRKAKTYRRVMSVNKFLQLLFLKYLY